MFAQKTRTSDRSGLSVDELIEPEAWPASESTPSEEPQKPRSVFATIREHEWFTAVIYVVCDIACWVLLYGAIAYIRRDQFFASPLEFVLVDCVVVVVILQALYIIGGYNRNTETRSLNYTTEHILAVIVAAAVSSFLIYSAAAYDAGMKPSRGVLLVSFVAFLPVSLFYRRVFGRQIAASAASRAFLVIGSGELAQRFYEAYRQSPNRQRLEFVDDDATRVGSTIAGPGSPIVEGGIAGRLAQINRRYSGVILAESVDRLSPELIERLVRTQFLRTRVYTLESFYEAHWRHVPVHTIDPFWPLQMGFQLARISPYHYLKRLFDLALSCVLLVIGFPLIGLLTCLVWLTSGRPAIFRQVRIGREGQPFTAYKFRTMRMQQRGAAQLSSFAEATADRSVSGYRLFATANPSVGGSEVGGPAAAGELRSEVRGRTDASADIEEELYTRADDPRVTRVGRWLRKLRLDELPQLWNVFRGDMSLIGPRAEWIKCAERYEKKIPFYHFRHLVKPGITGWAQVNYPYGESDEDAIEKLQYDLYYIRHYSLKLDAMIVLKTVHTMLFGRGQ